MSLPNDSILVTPGSGAQVGTYLVGSNEYQVVMVANVDGHIRKSKNVYFYNIAEQVHVAAASTVHWDMFNAHATLLVRVVSIRQRPSITTAVTGVAFSWTFQRTTSVGTGGAAQTAVLADLSQTALDASITCRSKPTGGAGAGTLQESYSMHSEETNVGVVATASVGGRELVPLAMSAFGNDERGLILRQNQGLSVTQTFNSVAGNTGWQIVFTVE